MYFLRCVLGCSYINTFIVFLNMTYFCEKVLFSGGILFFLRNYVSFVSWMFIDVHGPPWMFADAPRFLSLRLLMFCLTPVLITSQTPVLITSLTPVLITSLTPVLSNSLTPASSRP
jgi:hypothetical protein